MEVVLDWFEVRLAAQVGLERAMRSLIRDSAPAAPDPRKSAREGWWREGIEGACGELAVAKALGVYWNGSIDTYKLGGDVGELQVRTRSRANYDLIIRDRDRDEDIFILVVGTAPRFRIVGRIRGRDGKRDQWRRAHGGMAPAYFVPQCALRPFRSREAVAA